MTSACRVQLTAYRLDRLYRTHAQELFDGILEPGEHRIALDARAVEGGVLRRGADRRGACW